MDPISPLSIPSSFDPAIHLHSEANDNEGPIILPSGSNSDDFEAVYLQHEESNALKNRQGVVIRHRAWKTAEAFRSEEDHLSESPLKKHRALPESVVYFALPPSSPPPAIIMAPRSSPLAYPLSSSPPAAIERKRKRAHVSPNKRKRENLGPFIIDEDEDEDITTLEAVRLTNFGGNVVNARNTVIQSCPLNIPEADAQEPMNNRDGESDESCSRAVLGSTIGRQQATELFPTKIRRISATDKVPTCCIRTCSGKAFAVCQRSADVSTPFEQLITARSTSGSGRAKKSYYGVDIHQLLDEAIRDSNPALDGSQNRGEAAPLLSVERPAVASKTKTSKTLMWTEKYRAKKFTDLVGDERIHRSVLRWLKGWDPIVFPGSSRQMPKSRIQEGTTEERIHRKVLLLTGPPGFGKTTLAHVCARQAGYETLELNASDERSRDVVKGRIRDIVGTENVKGVNIKTAAGNVRKAGRPVCVVVDEVDGVVGGSSANGEGGFMKALIDLVALDQKNTSALGAGHAGPMTSKRKKRGDTFRLLRPLILICNDVYHPALRPLRSSQVAEIIHIRQPPLDKVVTRLKTVFELEGISCDGDGVRRLCEATWGVSNKREARTKTSGNGEGDIRSVLVIGEWVAGKLRASAPIPKLTKKWVEQHLLESLSHGGGGARAVGRGGAKEIVKRVFQEGAGFPKTTSIGVPEDFSVTGKVGVTEMAKKEAMDRLRELVDTSGECDRIVTDCFATYPMQPFQDDTLLSKPNAAYDWLHFHDVLSSKVFTGQDWELSPYLSQSVLALHHLFASSARQSWNPEYQKLADDEEDEPLPFSGPRADFTAFETEKHNKAILLGLQSALSVSLLRLFRSLEDIAIELLPRLITMLTPDVKPVIVGGSGDQRGIASVRKESERELVRRAVKVMSNVGVIFERARVETETSCFGGFVYRMEPPLDALASFETATSGLGNAPAPVRYAVRQVLDQEYQKHLMQQSAETRQARYRAGNPLGQSSRFEYRDKENESMGQEHKKPKVTGAKRDFFGRIVNDSRPPVGDGVLAEEETMKKRQLISGSDDEVNKVWVSFHEGFSNAVRKPITLEELMRGF
ncbi:MAG: hypothetical protein M1830_010714 [Pleopsidium flavum]|nr:MAG: hypothetical protein M1830_010714 [Pleopsidium flavum]